jgi:sugar lactone lactonase YvrE
VELIGLGKVEAPEDVIFDRAANLYCGTRHGDVVRFLAPDYQHHEVFAHIGGHPLGMVFDRVGTLVVCVGGMGLYAVAPDGAVSKVTDETNRSATSVNDDARLRLTDDCDIAPDGRIFFGEGTMRYEMHSWTVDALESRGNGRVVCYDPARRSTRTVLRNLLFANGVCLANDGQSILFAETWGCRVNRYWIAGPKAGRVEVVLGNLPGYPDNINRASDGTYWLALVGMRSPAVDLALQMPGFRRRMARRTSGCININTGCVVKFDDQGRIFDALWDLGGVNHPMITSMREHKGSFYRRHLQQPDRPLPHPRRRAGVDRQRRLLGSDGVIAAARRAYDRFAGRGEAAVTVSAMDGALRPNAALEEAEQVLAVLVSTGAGLRPLPGQAGDGEVISFDAEIACAASGPGDVLAVGLGDGRSRIAEARR